jgi:hypothetical protein
MNNRFEKMVKKFAKYGVWSLFAISIYMVFAAYFHGLCFIPLPFGEETVEKLNDIGKNVSLSYIAGAIFYFLSVYLPFVLKRSFVKCRCRLIIKNLLGYIKKFFEELCKQNDMSDVNQLYFDATQKEYEKGDICKLEKNQLFAIRKLITEIDHTLDTLLIQAEYIDADDFEILITIKSEAFLSDLRKIAQTSETHTTNSTTLLGILSGVVSMYGTMNNLKIIKNYG